MKQLSQTLLLYTKTHFPVVVIGYCITFIMLQAFSIPGTIFLVVIGGAIFGFKLGFALAIFNSTIGASCSYLLSYFTARHFVEKLFPKKLALFAEQIEKHRHNLFWYLMFLRLTPLVPNWFINLASPILNISFWVFCLATCFGNLNLLLESRQLELLIIRINSSCLIFIEMTLLIGIMPAVAIFVQTGLTLQNVSSSSDLAHTASTIIFLLLLGCISLLPTYPPVQNFLYEKVFQSKLSAHNHKY